MEDKINQTEPELKEIELQFATGGVLENIPPRVKQAVKVGSALVGLGGVYLLSKSGKDPKPPTAPGAAGETVKSSESAILAATHTILK
jgi:hypothetical protein